MPHDDLQSTLLERGLSKAKGIGAYRPLGIDPEGIMRAEVSQPLRGAGQVLPTARDVMELIKRLRGGLSKVPTGVNRLFQGTPMKQSVMDILHPSAQRMQEAMYQQANPLFRGQQIRGLWGQRGTQEGLSEQLAKIGRIARTRSVE